MGRQREMKTAEMQTIHVKQSLGTLVVLFDSLCQAYPHLIPSYCKDHTQETAMHSVIHLVQDKFFGDFRQAVKQEMLHMISRPLSSCGGQCSFLYDMA